MFEGYANGPTIKYKTLLANDGNKQRFLTYPAAIGDGGLLNHTCEGGADQ